MCLALYDFGLISTALISRVDKRHVPSPKRTILKPCSVVIGEKFQFKLRRRYNVMQNSSAYYKRVSSQVVRRMGIYRGCIITWYYPCLPSWVVLSKDHYESVPLPSISLAIYYQAQLFRTTNSIFLQPFRYSISVVNTHAHENTYEEDVIGS